VAELTALVSAMQMTDGARPVRWYVVRNTVLFAACEWSWTSDRTKATRLPADLADSLSHERRRELPMLPTLPDPSPAFFVSPFYGRDENEEVKEIAATPPVALPPRAAEKTVKERTQIAKRGAQTRKFNGLQAHAQWEKDHES
jgi:hypothetical protein